MTDFSKKNFYVDFVEDEKIFYRHEAGFNEREECTKIKHYGKPLRLWTIVVGLWTG